MVHLYEIKCSRLVSDALRLNIWVLITITLVLSFKHRPLDHRRTQLYQVLLILSVNMSLVLLKLFDQLFAHHLPDHLLILSKSILQPVKQIKEHLADVLLFIDRDLLPIVINNAFKHLRWISVFLIRTKHVRK